MRFLADMGISMATVGALRALGYEIVHLREVDLIRLSDEEIVSKAKREGRIVLTMDLDFGQIMALTRRSSHHGSSFLQSINRQLRWCRFAERRPKWQT